MLHRFVFKRDRNGGTGWELFDRLNIALSLSALNVRKLNNELG